MNWYLRKQPRKYRNIKQTYNGYSYMSKKEASKAKELDLLKRAGEIKDWEKQVKVELCGENGNRVCNYYVDFAIYHNDDTVEFLEIKGFKTDLWALKWKLLEDKYGKDKHYKLSVEY